MPYANYKKSFSVSDITPWLLIAGAIIVYPLLKNLVSGLAGATAAINTGLGLSDSDARKQEDAAYAAGNSPLSSAWFDRVTNSIPAGAPLFKVSDMQSLADQLQLAEGVLFENSAMAIAVFQKFKTKLQVGFFSKVFSDYTGEDLFTWMRKSDTPFAQGLSSQTVAAILNYINLLPLY